MDLMDKLRILTDSAKYDAACTSSGSDRGGQAGMLGSAGGVGIFHRFSAGGRCLSLLPSLLHISAPTRQAEISSAVFFF